MRLPFARLEVVDGIVKQVMSFDEETPSTIFVDIGIHIYNSDYPINSKSINNYRDIPITYLRNIIQSTTSKFMVYSEKLNRIIGL